MDQKNICIIEDNPDVLEVLSGFLEGQGFSILSFSSVEDYLNNEPQNFKGLYLVDWHLPGEPGVTLIHRIRQTDKISPIFMVSAFSKNSDIVMGLKSGADDYITKPFNFEELVVRINNAFSKFNYINENVENLSFKLLPEANSFIKDGETVSLTEREFVIFNKLQTEMSNPVTREELIDCFRNDDIMTVRNIDVHVFSLRKKIKKVAIVIQSVRGVGYKLVGN